MLNSALIRGPVLIVLTGAYLLLSANPAHAQALPSYYWSGNWTGWSVGIDARLVF
jgi:hypothetical protein